MESEVRTMRIGGSIGIIIPNQIVQEKRLKPEQLVRINLEKVSNVSFLWGRYKNVKIPTEEIMKEIDEGEDE